MITVGVETKTKTKLCEAILKHHHLSARAPHPTKCGHQKQKIDPQSNHVLRVTGGKMASNYLRVTGGKMASNYLRVTGGKMASNYLRVTGGKMASNYLRWHVKMASNYLRVTGGKMASNYLPDYLRWHVTKNDSTVFLTMFVSFKIYTHGWNSCNSNIG